MSQFGIFRIAGVEYDLDDLTLDEIELIEEMAGGVPFGEVNYGSAKGMKAFTYVLLRRGNPEVTMEEVGQTKVIQMMQPDEELPPLPPVPAIEDKSQSESEPDNGGTPDSPASTDG